MKATWTIALMVLLSFCLKAESEELTCVQAHQAALNSCKSYEHQIDVSHLSTLSQNSRYRAALVEKDRTFAMGRRCAKAQTACQKLCSSQTEAAVVSGGNWGMYSDLSSDCKEGDVAKHRAEMAQRYRAFSVMSSNRIVQHSPRYSYDVLGMN